MRSRLGLEEKIPRYFGDVLSCAMYLSTYRSQRIQTQIDSQP